MLVGFIRRRWKELKNENIATTLYKALILPVLEYGAVLWSPATKSETGMLEQLQRRFTRNILRIPANTTSECYLTYERRLKKLDLVKQSERRIIARVIFMKKLLDSPEIILSLNEFIYRNPSRRILRNARQFELPNISSNYANNNPMIASQQIYNNLQYLFDMTDSINVIRQKIRRHFTSKY